MEITEVRISLHEAGRLRAFANITFDDCFVVRGLKVIEGRDGFFIAMPSREVEGEGDRKEYRDIAHPITNEMREYIETKVLEEYHATFEGESPNYTF
ncbi:MAG: hypothetical protein D6675_00680 [Gemmatimonadetes bacterium]|nr:MAG: hypothetical protein D6675_00680 [Gemmatimonadota bacterium]